MWHGDVQRLRLLVRTSRGHRPAADLGGGDFHRRRIRRSPVHGTGSAQPIPGENDCGAWFRRRHRHRRSHRGLIAAAVDAAQLIAWFDAEARELPWRAPDTTPWGVLVSEVMLQQTPVHRVAPVWIEWLGPRPPPPRTGARTP